MRRLFDWIINNFSYVQIYVFICSLFIFSLCPIGYFWFKTHNDHLKNLEDQLHALQEERVLVSVLNLVQQFRITAQRSYFDPKNLALKKELEDLSSRIANSFAEFGSFNIFELATNGTVGVILKEAFPLDFKKRWEEIVQNYSGRSLDENESLETKFISDINLLFDYLSNIAGISYFEEIHKYVFIQSLFLRLPQFQENLSFLFLTTEKMIANPALYPSKDLARSLVDSLATTMTYFDKIFSIIATPSAIAHPEDLNLIDLVEKYTAKSLQIIRLIEQQVITPQQPTLSAADFAKASEGVLSLGTDVWKEALINMVNIFGIEQKFVLGRLWSVLLTTLVLSGSAFLLGLALTYRGIVRLSELTQATVQFSNGDLSVRVSDHHEDAIGKQAQAFNQMAAQLEQMIHSLYELIEATTALSQGQLSKRIPLQKKDANFNEVALSFNKMAETFEKILGRLKQIGSMLTTSASKIALASKEHESIVVDQEKTTKEIAFAASDISSTAKALAKTVNEVSQNAEETSSLALKGKDALNNMEKIMRSMVDASSTIASKLQILNEKAGNITSVITTITKVADQTNLLSLNASIEAEKAGEYGRSFAVIAREIRRLADQSALATLDIEKMVSEIMKAVSSSVMGVDDFTQEIRKGVEQIRAVSGQLASIIEQVQAFTARFEMVNQGMQTQSTGAEQINQAIGQLSRTAQMTAEAIHQFYRTVKELNQAANELSILNPFNEK